MDDRSVITATHVLCALGAGVDAVLDRMLAGESGLRPWSDGCAPAMAEPIFAGAIDPALWRQVEQARPDLPRADALALAAARQVGAMHPSPLTPRDGLILSTTKADTDALFDQARRDPAYQPPDTAEPVDMLRTLEVELFGKLVVASGGDQSGPRQVVSNACASGLVALMQADRWVRRGICDRVLVVAVDVLSAFVVRGFASLAALSAGPCRPFDAARDGISLGEAAAAVMVERGGTDTPPLAVIRTGAHTSDGFHLTAPARGGPQLRRAIRLTLAQAGVAPGDVDYVNAHGTATPFNDEAEACAIADSLDAATPVASMKGYLGHTLGAAGLLEAALCVAMIRRGEVPASLGCDTPGVPRDIAILRQNLKRDLRHVLTLKTGFGGLNAAMLLERPDA